MKDVNQLSMKTYECTNCGHETEELTNHFGEIYTECKVCKNRRHKYTGEIPEGGWVPPPWKESTEDNNSPNQQKDV